MEGLHLGPKQEEGAGQVEARPGDQFKDGDQIGRLSSVQINTSSYITFKYCKASVLFVIAIFAVYIWVKSYWLDFIMSQCTVLQGIQSVYILQFGFLPNLTFPIEAYYLSIE